MQNSYQKQIIKAERLFNLISPAELQPYIDKYRSDFSVNKLYTIIFLKLFLYCWMFDRNDFSLRTIAQNSCSQTFKQLAQLSQEFSIGKTSLSQRLTRIPYRLFQDLFERLANKTLSELPNNQQCPKNTLQQLISRSHILDSTIITLSAKLLQAGYQINEGQLSIKASMAIHGRQIPIKALVLAEKTYASEDNALPELFNFSQKDVIYIFDRGIQRLQTYQDIAAHGSYFVSRLKAERYSMVKKNKLPKQAETETLIVVKDENIIFQHLKDKNCPEFRLITAISKKDGKELHFITNLANVSATDITELYKHRWSIEVFFRFLKSELHLKNLLSYSENGIKVHIYLTLLVFLLTWIYKEQNIIQSFKLAREQLKWSLLDILMKQQFQKGILLGIGFREFIDTS